MKLKLVWGVLLLLIAMSSFNCVAQNNASEESDKGPFQRLKEPEGNPYDKNLSIVYGYVDMTDAPTQLDAALLVQFRPLPYTGYEMAIPVNGLFYHYAIPKGSFQIVILGGNFYNYKIKYALPRGRNQTAVRFKKPGVYFMGAYRMLFTSKKGDFRLVKLGYPTEEILLTQLLNNTFKKDPKRFSRQINMVEAKLKQLASRK